MVSTLAESLPAWWEPRAFRDLARAEMSARFGTPLEPARLPGFPHPFDLVSEDGALIGAILPPSARHARGGLSALQRAELSEHVLALTCAPAQQRVIVLGGDRARLAPWLVVYGHLARDVEFWHLPAPGHLERLLL